MIDEGMKRIFDLYNVHLFDCRSTEENRLGICAYLSGSLCIEVSVVIESTWSRRLSYLRQGQ